MSFEMVLTSRNNGGHFQSPEEAGFSRIQKTLAETQARTSCIVAQAARMPWDFFLASEAAGVAVDQEAQGVPKCTYQSCLRPMA